MAAALIVAGVSPGAALAFLMTGPATNAAAITTIWRIMGKKTAIIYLLTVAVTAFAAGLLLDGMFNPSGIKEAVMHRHGDAAWYEWFKGASAIVLLMVLAWAFFKPLVKLTAAREDDASGEAIRLSITGMTCQHCVAAATRALTGVSGVASADVDLKSGSATVRGSDIDTEALLGAVRALGFEVTIERSDTQQ